LLLDKIIFDLFHRCDSSGDFLIPTFVTISSTEIPLIPADTFSQLTSEISKFDRTLKLMKEKVTVYDLNYLLLPYFSSSKLVENQATIVISTIPIDVNDLIKGKDDVTKIFGHEAFHTVKASGDVLFLRIETTAEKDLLWHYF